MKFLHLSDLHIGKKINDYSLKEDQRYVLTQAKELAKNENVDAIVVAGDIYDSSVPTAEASELYDWFLSSFFELGKPILMVSGNHDSSERLHVASAILKRSGIYIATNVKESIEPIKIAGVNFYLLPFFRPSEVNRAFGSEAKNYEDALKVVVENMAIERSETNVIVAHQAFLPMDKKMEQSGSETSLTIDSSGYVGGTESISVNVLSSFDYAALGHIHKAQNIASNARYAGALLKYHIDEANAKRSFTVVSIDNKKVEIEEHPISSLHDLVILTGDIDELLSRSGNENDYVYCKLTNESLVDSPMAKLKAKYPFCLGLEYPRTRVQSFERPDYEDVEEVDKNDLFATFFENYGGRELEEDERKFVKELFEQEEGE
ncbi:MAG: exonuclease SbcCD subunit D [Bacilli bacterium]|nr:exonuclease SbcCD subunit D [Bacilli bacterium]